MSKLFYYKNVSTHVIEIITSINSCLNDSRQLINYLMLFISILYTWYILFLFLVFLNWKQQWANIIFITCKIYYNAVYPEIKYIYKCVILCNNSI